MWEADRKHAETVLKCAGVENGNGIARYKSQSVIAFSFGKAEFMQPCWLAQLALRHNRFIKNIGVDLKTRVLMDAAAGIAMI